MLYHILLNHSYSLFGATLFWSSPSPPAVLLQLHRC